MRANKILATVVTGFAPFLQVCRQKILTAAMMINFSVMGAMPVIFIFTNRDTPDDMFPTFGNRF